MLREKKNKIYNDSRDVYLCGFPGCGKLYHSYTAFYNHCKKQHMGDLPPGTQLNGKLFSGPSKNRGRPRLLERQRGSAEYFNVLKQENILISYIALKLTGQRSAIQHVKNPSGNLYSLVVFSPDLCLSLSRHIPVSCATQYPQLYDPFDAPEGKADFGCLEQTFRELRPQTLCEELSALLVWLSRHVTLEALQQISAYFSLIIFQEQAVKLEEQTQSSNRLERLGKLVGSLLSALREYRAKEFH